MEAGTIWLNVTNDQLLASTFVTLLFIFILICAIGINLYRFIRIKKRPVKSKVISVLLIVACVAGIVYAYSHYRIEDGLLYDYKYIKGTTSGFCDVPFRGKGIAYTYEWEGTTYYGCRTFHPIPEEDLIIDGGTYMVRFSSKFPKEGRMDFDMPDSSK